MKTTHEIRKAFIDYFVGKGHRHVASSSLVPGNDPTLLFTNSGMVQFKDTFLGADKREYSRATTAQRCVRAGGKHNDLDSVGYTARHHTFFEMLGNFSFGDYFKRDAIHYAWELLTGVYGLPADKLWITVYHTDDEAFDIWNKEVGVPADRITRIGDNKGAPFASDNFWQMADTGPCGPCSEIFYDHGPEIAGGPPGTPEGDGDRYIEIWNLVFMQFDRASDGTMSRLPKPCVDTGMGLERLAAVLQHVHNNFEIDLFQGLISAAARLTGTSNLAEGSLRVVADHIRACAFLIVDGVLPSNEGRGYVLRRIIRRALRHGWKLGVRGAFFHQMVAPLVAAMGEAYPELAQKQGFVEQVLAAEEERFADLLVRGMARLDKLTSEQILVCRSVTSALNRTKDELYVNLSSSSGLQLDGVLGTVSRHDVAIIVPVDGDVGAVLTKISRLQNIRQDGSNEYAQVVVAGSPDYLTREIIESVQALATGIDGPTTRVLEIPSADLVKGRIVSGTDAFVLYDTYGFPIDLTADVCRERGWVVDLASFERELEAQRERARSAGNFGGGVVVSAETVDGLAPTVFLGYEALNSPDAQVLRILVDGQSRSSLQPGEHGIVVLDRTPFYAESGGQVGDHGLLVAGAARFVVSDTIKLAGAFHGHVGSLSGTALTVGDRVGAEVDAARRQAIVLNHSATHLLHAALREELGDHVQQKGSLVAPERLRFDFSHFQPINAEQLARIEARVNEQVRVNAQAEVHHMAMQEALDFGAMALFGEKYGDHVRVLKMGDYSTELCGGTHVARTGDIGLFKIVSEGGISAGVRRIEAVTGAGAVALVQEHEARMRELAGLLGGGAGDQVIAKVQQLLEKLKKEEKEIAALKSKAAGASVDEMANRAVDVGAYKVLAERLEGIDAKVLREMLDRLKQKLVDAVVVLASAQDGKATLIAGVSGGALSKVKAGDVLAYVATRAGGKGGGRPDMAQGGANDGPELKTALAEIPAYVASKS